MATFSYKSIGHGMPYGAPHDVAFAKRVDLPSLIANQPLDATLPSTGFAASDILRVFEVPAGFLLKHIGVRVVTAEGATCTADIGNASDTATHLLAAAAVGYMGTLNLNSAVVQTVLVTDTHLGANTGAGAGHEGVVFVEDDYIEITFGHANTNACIFDVWAAGWKVF